MPEPFNYVLNVPPPDFGRNFLQGMAIVDASRKREEDAKSQAAMAQRNQAMQQEIYRVTSNPSVSGIRNLMVQFPELADKLKEPLANMTDEQKAARIRQANDVFMPMISGNRELGLKNLKTYEEAAKNSGDTDSARSLGMYRELVESEESGKAGDNTVAVASGMALAAALGEKEFAKFYETLDKSKREDAKEVREAAEAPFKLSKAKADALIAQNKAEVGEDKQTLNTATGIYERQPDGAWKNTGLKPVVASGVSVNLGTPQFAIEESTGQPVIYQPSPSGKTEIIRGLRPITDQGKDAAKEKIKIDKLINVVDLARETLSKATGSYAGAAGAGALRLVGVSSDATKANSKLKALQAAMMMNMPRMEGPQSNADAQLYREQAGQIGDPTIPVQDRLAALDIIMELIGRYGTSTPKDIATEKQKQPRTIAVDF